VPDDIDRVDVEFMVRPNGLPIAIGCVVLGIVLLSVFLGFKGRPSGMSWLALVFASIPLLVGLWFVFDILLERRAVPRSLSADGVELRNGETVPWANVSLIEQKPPTYPNGGLLERTDIKFDNGKTASVSSDWVENFFQVNEYLVKKTHDAGLGIPAVSPARSVSVTIGESPMAASAPLQRQNNVPEKDRIDVEFSMAQYIYVALFTPGLILFGIYLFSLVLQPSTKITGWTFYLMLLIPVAFMILGVAFPFMMRRGRRKVARSFSARGVELWNGTVIPWQEVNAITGGSQFISTGRGGGTTYRKLDIKFRDGGGVYVSGYWASNFGELENYLARLPQYSP
jgi:hypothetical protein